ncbi:MAG: hypothetical protein E3J72_01815 [Planctomycetota bacterium]|nr:MAG: hypothetical protein E3J72_01815 [Planctomycetota bacterium]
MKSLVIPALVILICIFAVVIVIVIKETTYHDKPVVFSPEGVPHCPYCYIIVKPFTDYCYFCQKNFSWTDGMSVCWDCEGAGARPEQERKHPGRKKKWPGEIEPISVEGFCLTCQGEGFIWHVSSPVKNWDTRFGLSITEPAAPAKKKKPARKK